MYHFQHDKRGVEHLDLVTSGLHLAEGASVPSDGVADATSVDVRLESVRKVFGDAVAVDGVSLDVASGEFFSLLGPSGSGKTTCLRMIAGFEEPSEGRIFLHGRDVTNQPPYERDVNTVFQDYALFPHMTVADNVDYGLKVKKVPRSERQQRVAEALRMVRLEGYERRKPNALSGGQRQRVALARALVNRPRVLLLDEPLGALDLKLRQQMQVELKAIQQSVGITFIYVTHDQEEALTMSDRLAVMNQGRIEQVGSPSEVYERPVSGFVADFVGISNVIPSGYAEKLTGRAEPISIRPEKIRLSLEPVATDGSDHVLSGVVSEVFYLGSATRYRVEVEDGPSLIVTKQNLKTSSSDALQIQGQRVYLSIDPQHIREVDG